ncbi:hypothetical protein BML2537_16750 [Providencia stuartii]|nr:hypothetical protein BML2537_16750 [Providencia stuartii]
MSEKIGYAKTPILRTFYSLRIYAFLRSNLDKWCLSAETKLNLFSVEVSTIILNKNVLVTFKWGAGCPLGGVV